MVHGRLGGCPMEILSDGAGAHVNSNVDVPAAVYEHALLCEFAHARLCRTSPLGINC